MRDYLDLLAEELTLGTKLPVAYAREVIKLTALAALPSSHPTLDWFPIHRRQYLILVSETPGTGKGETFRRVKATVEKAQQEGGHWPLDYVLGDELGSPQYAAVRFGGDRSKPGEVKPSIPVVINHPGRIVHYDEGKRLLQQDNVGYGAERGLLTMFTQLFESNKHAMGSLQNGSCSVTGANVSLVLQFTRTGFEAVFTGRGATSSGFLSRCTLVSAEPSKVAGVWRKVSSEKVRELVGKIQECAKRTELGQDAGVEDLRSHLFQQLEGQDNMHSARLQFLFAQDAFARGLFSEEGRVTRAAALAAANWTRNQFNTRELLWPLDHSPDKGERVYMTLLKAFGKTPEMTFRDMKRACHTDRAGSGGIQVLTYTLRTMVAAGEVVKDGRNRQGTELFKWKG